MAEDPLNTNRTIFKAKAKKFHSLGRGQVCAPQCVTVLTHLADVEGYFRRQSAEHLSIYPVGDRPIHDMLKGELAFSYVEDQEYVPPSGYNPNMTATRAFTAFNGLPLTQEVRFAGVVDKEWSCGGASTDKTDTAITLRIHGTHTIINTGEETIPAGSSIYWIHPLFQCNQQGRVEPRIEIVGVPKQKFVASLRVLNMDSVFGTFAAIQRETRAIIVKIEPDIHDRNDKAVSIMKQLESVAERYGLIRLVDLSSAGDMKDAGLLTPELVSRRDETMKSDPVRRYIGYVAFAHGVTNDWWTSTSGDDQHLHFMRNLESSRNALYSHQPMKRRKHNADPKLAAKGASVIYDAEAVAANLHMLAACVLDYQHIISKRVIGYALSTAPPGGKVMTSAVFCCS
jgi:hypothetical protein